MMPVNKHKGSTKGWQRIALWWRVRPSDSLTATSLIGQILSARSVIGHQGYTSGSVFFLQKVCRLKIAATLLMSSSYHDTDQYRGNIRRIQFNIKSIGKSRFIRKAIDRNQLNDFSVSFSPDLDLHCSCSKKTREQLKSVTPDLIMEGTSQENKSQIFEIRLTKNRPAWSVCREGGDCAVWI